MDWILTRLKRLGGHHHRDHDEQMHLFYLVLVIQLVVQAAIVLIHRGQRISLGDGNDLSWVFLLAAYVLILAWLFRGRMAWPVAFALLLLSLWSLSRALPDARMESFLLVYITAVLFLLRDDGAERPLAMGSLRWICAIGWLWLGIQKLLHGLYFQGAYPAWQIATNPDSHLILGHFVDARAMDQLLGYAGAAGSGPYAGHGTLLSIVANGIWALEILVGLGLLYWKTRPTAILIGFAMLLAGALIDREIFGALLFFNLLLLYASPAYHRAGAAAILLLCAFIVAGALGVTPELVPAP